MFGEGNIVKKLAELSLYDRLKLTNSKEVIGRFQDLESGSFSGSFRKWKRERLISISQTDKYLYFLSDSEREDNKKGTKVIKIHGPFQGIPEFIVISGLEEKRELEKYGRPHITQEQLIILDDFQYHRYVGDTGIITDEFGVYFINKSGLKESGDYIEPPEEWLSSLKVMLERFVKKGGLYGNSDRIDNRIIFESDFGRNKILENLEEMELERV